jgi:PAP2 superfamily
MSLRLRISTSLSGLRPISWLVATAWLVVASLAIASPAAAAGVANAVLDWNQVALTATTNTVPPQGPQPQARTMAIVHAAVHDAVNGITGEYDTYLPTPAPPANASPDGAAIGAAHYALTRLFPPQAATFDAAKTATLGTYNVNPLDPGIGFGEAAAKAIVDLRSIDGFAQAQFPYTPPGAGNPGVWVPVGTAPALLPGLGAVSTWVLTSGSQFRPDGPPPLTGRRYARDYNEIKEVGSLTSATRTAEQTSIAQFWLGTPATIWNDPARQVLMARGSSLSESARTLALMYVAAADAAIACWDAKYTYLFWRPITAIRNGGIDDNADTVPDIFWQPLFPTPQHPEYTSGHSTNSSAMATILGLVFGDAPGVPVVASSPTNVGFTRIWTKFSEGVEEVIDARVYSGIHYRNSDEVGAKLGAQVARFVFTHALKESKGK